MLRERCNPNPDGDVEGGPKPTEKIIIKWVFFKNCFEVKSSDWKRGRGALYFRASQKGAASQLTCQFYHLNKQTNKQKNKKTKTKSFEQLLDHHINHYHYNYHWHAMAGPLGLVSKKGWSSSLANSGWSQQQMPSRWDPLHLESASLYHTEAAGKCNWHFL